MKYKPRTTKHIEKKGTCDSPVEVVRLIGGHHHDRDVFAYRDVFLREKEPQGLVS